MKKIISSIITSLLFMASSGAFAFGLGVSPTFSELNIEAGKTYRQKITVANMGTGNPLSIVVGLASWSIDENGKMVLVAPTQVDTDAASWFKFSPASFTLASQKNVEILVDISIPLNVEKKEYRVAVLSSTVLPSQDVMKKSKNVWEKVQVASLIYLSPSKELFSNSSLTVTPIKNSKKVELLLDNKGDKHSRVSGTMDVMDGDKKVYSVDFNLVLMPKQARKTEVKFDVPIAYKGKNLRIVPNLIDTMSQNNSVNAPKDTPYIF